MKTTLLLAAADAAVALTAVPADARHHPMRAAACAKWKHGRCVSWHRMTRAQARHAAMYRVGYRFAPSYGYTDYTALPSTYRTRYHLNPDYRYVYRDNYIYVVDPKTYAVQQVIYALTH